MKFKTDEIVSVYKTLNNAKVTKMSLEDKMTVVKLLCALKPISDGFDNYISTINEKFKDDKFKEMEEKVNEIEKGNKKNITEEEELSVKQYFSKYNKDITVAINEELNKEIEVEFNTINEDAFGKLVDSNDFTCAQIVILLSIIVNK